MQQSTKIEHHVIPRLETSGVFSPIYLQHNASCHKVKPVMNYLMDQVEVMDWPAQSPDMNPIENFWRTVGEKIIARNPINVEDL